MDTKTKIKIKEEIKMPWTTSDVDRFKKGLSARQKRQWVEVANSALSSCMKKGGSENSCAASAIRQANGVVGKPSNNELLEINLKFNDYSIEERQHQGKTYWVIPVTMMVEGVHHGSRGALYHSIEELGKVPNSWNGIPVVINHPTSTDGNFISANSPDVIDGRCVGHVYNTHVEGNKLKAEAWIDPTTLQRVDAEAFTRIQNRQMMEVSIGVFSDEDDTPGVWHGEEYTAVAYNHRPDHLALLPEAVGACSIEDGCGLRTNEKGGIDVSDFNKEKKDHIEAIIAANADQGYRTIVENAQRHLDSMDSNNVIHFLEDIYDGYMIYRKRNDNSVKYFKQNYQMNNDNFELTGSPVEVNRKVSFEPVTNSSKKMQRRNKPNVNNNKKEDIMSKECTPCEKVNAIINSNQNSFVEDDRETLMALEESVLDKLVPKEEKKPVVVNTVIQQPEVKITNEMVMNALTDEQKADLVYGRQQRLLKRTEMINHIQTNVGKEVWTDEAVNALSDAMLEKIAKSIKVEKKNDLVDFSMLGGAMNLNQSTFGFGGAEEAPLYPTGIEVEKSK
jgi:hypothetical protein